MLPEGWRKEKLGAVAEFQRGFDLPQSQRSEGSVPIISSSGASGFHDTAKALAPGIVTGRYGSIGDVFYVEEAYWPLNTALWVKDFHGNYPKYLYYLLSNFDFSKFSDKTGVPGVNRNDLHAVNVLVPPLPEQKKIAAILSTWDRAIEGTEKLLANSQQQKKALMQQLLTGKKRLPGFTGEWKIGAISEIAHIDTGFAFKSSEFTDDANGMPVIRMSDLKDGTLNLENCKRIRLNSLSGLEKFSLKINDFIFGMSGSLSNFAWVKNKNLPCYLNQRVGRIRSKATGDQQFISYLYLSEKIQKEIEDKAAGAAQLNISLNDIRDMKIHIPPLSEQKAIAAVLTTADTEITAIESDLSRLRQEKKALMQQLLTGKRRVTVD